MRMMRGFILLLATTAVPTVVSAQTYPTNKDPRSTLKPGRYDAGTAISNMKQVSFVKKPAAFDSASGLKFINSDMAFGTHYVYQANFAGFTIWDISEPAKPPVGQSIVVVRPRVVRIDAERRQRELSGAFVLPGAYRDLGAVDQSWHEQGLARQCAVE